MKVKSVRCAFTTIELITVVAIIAMLVALLVPSLTMVRNAARRAQQKAQFNAIAMALEAFKQDYGDYPPSDWPLPPDPESNYCGAQKLAEALLGLDLLGFHPESDWRADGTKRSGGYFLYDPTRATDIQKRKGPYLETSKARAFRLGDIFDFGSISSPLATAPGPLTFVICDVYGWKKVELVDATGKIVQSTRAGAPILYYKANTVSKTIDEPTLVTDRVYDVTDNIPVIELKQSVDGREHPLANPNGNFRYFYFDYIRDPRVTAKPWPYRPDSYILISAGRDGLYGTEDDITNFKN